MSLRDSSGDRRNDRLWEPPGESMPDLSLDARPREVTIRVASSVECMRLQMGACRRLDDAPLDRQVLLACAVEFCIRPRRRRVWLSNIASLLGITEDLVWEVLVRHELFDEEALIRMRIFDPFERFGLDEDAVLASDFVGVQLCTPESEWADDFLALAVRRWPDDVCGVVVDLLSSLGGDYEGWGPTSAAHFLGNVFESVEPGWWMEPYFEGVKRGRGHLVDRVTRMPLRRPSRRRRHAAILRPFADDERGDFFARLARRLVTHDLGHLPELVLHSRAREWPAYGQLISTLLQRRLPGICERFEERLLEPEGLLEFLAALAQASVLDLGAGMGLLYDMVTGTEESPRRFVETLRARRGWDLPRPMRVAVMQGLSLGLAGMVEVVRTVDADLGPEILAIIEKWRGELGLFVWSQAVGYADSAVDWRG